MRSYTNRFCMDIEIGTLPGKDRMFWHVIILPLNQNFWKKFLISQIFEFVGFVIPRHEMITILFRWKCYLVRLVSPAHPDNLIFCSQSLRDHLKILILHVSLLNCDLPLFRRIHCSEYSSSSCFTFRIEIASHHDSTFLSISTCWYFFL